MTAYFTTLKTFNNSESNKLSKRPLSSSIRNSLYSKGVEKQYFNEPNKTAFYFSSNKCNFNVRSKTVHKTISNHSIKVNSQQNTTLATTSQTSEEGGKAGGDLQGCAFRGNSSSDNSGASSFPCGESEEENGEANHISEIRNVIKQQPQLLEKIKAINSIEDEIKHYEKDIEVLSRTKYSKQCKVDDLRCLIKRIASEHCFSAMPTNYFNFVNPNSKSFRNTKLNAQNEHVSKRLQHDNYSSKEKVQKSSKTGNSTASQTEYTLEDKDDCSEGDLSGPEESFYFVCRRKLHFNMCSFYWQTNVSDCSKAITTDINFPLHI